MAVESSAHVGSGIQVLREVHNVRALRGSNSVVVNYEDVNSSLGVTASSGLTVAGDAVHLTGPTTRMRGRRKLLIQNLGAGLLYIGPSTVTAANGLEIAVDAILELDVLDFGNIYGISDGVSDVRVLELR